MAQPAKPAASEVVARAAAGPTGGAAAQPEAQIVPDRALVRQAELTVRVHDVGAAATRVGDIARAAGGEVYADNRAGSRDTARADLVIKVEPGRLDSTLDQVARLGTEEQRSSSTEDVTEQVADVDSRVATMKASIARVRAVLSRASSVGDVVAVEGELAKREAELESLQARQRALAGQVSLATVTAHLVAATAPPAPADRPAHGFLAGLRGGWQAFAGAVGWLLTVLGAVLPFAVVVLPFVAGWFVTSRRRRRAASAAAPADPGALTPAR